MYCRIRSFGVSRKYRIFSPCYRYTTAQHDLFARQLRIVGELSASCHALRMTCYQIYFQLHSFQPHSKQFLVDGVPLCFHLGLQFRRPPPRYSGLCWLAKTRCSVVGNNRLTHLTCTDRVRHAHNIGVDCRIALSNYFEKYHRVAVS